MQILVVVLLYLVICQVVANQFGSTKLSRGSALTQLRVSLIHLFWTQTAIGIDKCSTGIRIWWTIIFIIIIFENGSPCLSYLW